MEECLYGPAPTRMPSFPRVRAMAGKTKICDFSYLRRIAAESARRRGSSEFGKGKPRRESKEFGGKIVGQEIGTGWENRQIESEWPSSLRQTPKTGTTTTPTLFGVCRSKEKPLGFHCKSQLSPTKLAFNYSKEYALLLVVELRKCPCGFGALLRLFRT